MDQPEPKKFPMWGWITIAIVVFLLIIGIIILILYLTVWKSTPVPPAPPAPPEDLCQTLVDPTTYKTVLAESNGYYNDGSSGACIPATNNNALGWIFNNNSTCTVTLNLVGYSLNSQADCQTHSNDSYPIATIQPGQTTCWRNFKNDKGEYYTLYVNNRVRITKTTGCSLDNYSSLNTTVLGYQPGDTVSITFNNSDKPVTYTHIFKANY